MQFGAKLINFEWAMPNNSNIFLFEVCFLAFSSIFFYINIQLFYFIFCYSLNATLADVLVWNASHFEVRHIENNLDEFWAKFEVFLPSLDGKGKYTVVGNALGKDVKGNGDFRYNNINKKSRVSLRWLHKIK